MEGPRTGLARGTGGDGRTYGEGGIRGPSLRVQPRLPVSQGSSPGDGRGGNDPGSWNPGAAQSACGRPTVARQPDRTSGRTGRRPHPVGRSPGVQLATGRPLLQVEPAISGTANGP